MRWSVEQGLVRGCCCEVCKFAVCLFVVARARVALLAHPLTTLLCAAVVDDGARCVQGVSLPPPSRVSLSCVFVVCGWWWWCCCVWVCGVCCICLLCV